MMKTKITIVLVVLATLSGCRQIERITSSRVERIDSVQVQVPIARHVLDVPFIWSDSILVEDDRIRVRIISIPEDSLSADVEMNVTPKFIETDNSRDVRSEPIPKKRYRIIAEVKPDTQEVKVAEKTITETKETVKYNRKMPWWGSLLIGGLIAVVIVLLVARKINR